jgi:hypothetical protein
MKSISVQYQELKENKISKHQFLRNARMMFPNFVTNHNSFDDSVKILKNKGLLNEGDAVKGTPDKAPSYDYPTQPGKYMKVVQEPEVDEQDGIYPATTLTDIPKEEVSKPIKSKNRPDGLEPAKDKDKKNEMKKIRIVKESKKKLTENQDDAAFDAMIKKAMEEEEAEKAIKSGFGIYDPNEDKKPFRPKLDLGKSSEKFFSQFRSPGASGPGQSSNGLRETIKKMVNKVMDEYEKGDESDKAPKVSQAINIVVNDVIDSIESNDIDLEFKSKDVEDILNNFQDTIGYRYSDEQFETIIDKAIEKLKEKRYNIK